MSALDSIAGKECFRFYECEHVYCRDCMVQHFSVRVQDGEVNNLRCPHDQCETIAHPTQVRQFPIGEHNYFLAEGR